MICTDQKGLKYVVKFKYDHSRKRVKTTCSMKLWGEDLIPRDVKIMDHISVTVTLDSRDQHIKKKARKKALAKVLGQSEFNKRDRTAIWASYFDQSKV